MWFFRILLLVIYMFAVVDRLPTSEKRELVFLLSFTCNYVVSVRSGSLFLLVLEIFILLWLILGIPYNYNFSFLAHRSRRLQGELIGYSWSGVRPSSGRRRPPSIVVVNNFKHLLLQNRLPNQSHILYGASLCRGNESLFAASGHMTKMAAMPIYGKNPSKIFFSRTGRPIFTKLSM